MAWEESRKILYTGGGKGRTEKPLIVWSNSSSSYVPNFGGASRPLGIYIDGFTDLWQLGKAGKGVGFANRTTVVHRSFAPSSVEELG